MKRTWSVALVVVFLAVCSARADQVTLKNGDRLTGTIVKSDDKEHTLLVKTEFAGDVNVKWDAISSIVSSQPLHLTTKDGQTIVGTVTASEDQFKVVTNTTGEVTAKKESIVAVRNDAEQKAYDTEIDRLRNPKLTDFWSGVLDTGLSLTRGNSESTTYTLAGKAARVTAKDKIGVYATAIYAKDNTTPPERTTAHAIRGGVRFDLNLTPKLFVFGLTDFEYDEFQNLDLRNSIGGGLGYYLIKNERIQFDVFGGGTFLQEYFSVPINPAVSPATSRKSGEIIVGEELAAKIGSKLTLSERFAIYPNLSESGQYRFTFDTTAAIKLKSWLSWQSTFSDYYISNPVPGKKTNDILLASGLRLQFGKGVF